jgi:two-component system sensor kinase FixL
MNESVAVCPEELFERYLDLQKYLNWTYRDRDNLVWLGPLLVPRLPLWLDDFYQEITRHPRASVVLTGGDAQVTRLKATLMSWLQQLFHGQYDLNFVQTRWRVGLRHSQIGLHQVYANAALSRLRRGMHQGLRELDLPAHRLWELIESLDKLLDLDLAVIADSYEFHRLQLVKSAERERSEQKFRNLVEAAACMIVIMRDDFRVAYISPYAEHLTGYLAEEVKQRSFLELFVDPQENEAAEEAFFSAPSRLPVKNVDLPIRCRDGSRRWLVWNAIRLEDFEGKPAVLAVGHDITDKRRASERLLQAERLVAIGQTITGLAHESRNALQRIHSCTELLEFEVDDRPEAMQLIRRSLEAQDDLTRLFDEVRDFAAPISLDLSLCSIAKIWRDAWSLVQPDCAGRDVMLLEVIHQEDLELSVDRFRLVQVFRNLYENSLAASDDPVRIRVTCQVIPPPRDRPEPQGQADVGAEEWVEISVRDNGPGLGPRACREVFEPFFTTKTKGTGLGMAIAYRILAAHGGSISVGQYDCPGAEFILRLPRVRP